jgi:hypothetical protein
MSNKLLPVRYALRSTMSEPNLQPRRTGRRLWDEGCEGNTERPLSSHKVSSDSPKDDEICFYRGNGSVPNLDSPFSKSTFSTSRALSAGPGLQFQSAKTEPGIPSNHLFHRSDAAPPLSRLIPAPPQRNIGSGAAGATPKCITSFDSLMSPAVPAHGSGSIGADESEFISLYPGDLPTKLLLPDL